MQIITPIDLTTLRRHEQSTRSGARLGQYQMDVFCPPDTFQLIRATLDPADWQRLYLIGEFAGRTRGNTGRIIDLNFEELSTVALARVQSFIAPPAGTGLSPVDLRQSLELVIIIVTADIHARALVIIDGNHRAIAHYHRFGPVAGVPAIVCIHGNIEQWPYVPLHAGNRQRL